MNDKETDIPRIIFKLMGTKRSAKRWREYGQFGLILLALGAIILGIAWLQMLASKLP